MRTIQDDINKRNRNTPFQRFLLANRPYCELCTGPYPSTRIIKLDNRDTAVCDSHWRAYNPIRAGLEQRARMEAHR